MAERQINPWLKQVLELGPPILFFVVYLQIREREYVIGSTTYDGFIVAAAIFVPILLASISALWWLTGKLSRMQAVTVVLVVVFGALTVWFNDDRFFKMKTSIVYGLLAAMLGVGLLQGKSYLAFVMDEIMPMTHEGWMILTRRLALMFLALAIANEIVWRTMSDDAWVTIETFVFPVALFVFFLAHGKLLADHAPDDG